MKKVERKRIAANIINDGSSTDQLSTEDIKITTRKPRTKVPCYCSKCNGKLVDPRTKNAHDQKGQMTSLESLHSEQLASLSTAIFPDETPMSQVLVEQFDSAMEIEQTFDSAMEIDTHLTQTIPDNDGYEERIFTFLPRKKKVKTSTFRHITEIEESEDIDNTAYDESEDIDSTEYDTDDIYTGESSGESFDESSS